MADRDPVTDLQPESSSEDATAIPWAEARGRLEKAQPTPANWHHASFGRVGAILYH